MFPVRLLSRTRPVVITCVRNATKERVQSFSHACHKRFSTLEQAQAFITNYDEAKQCLTLRETSQSEPLENLMQLLSID
jgi:viroplasmin and RNaseH domain-containing protein